MTKILIVDDEKFLCLSLARLLKKNGFDAAIALNGPEALSVLEAEPHVFSLALIDVHMPGWDGEETAKRLKAIAPGLKMIMMTGYSPHFSPEGEAPRFAAAIADAFLFKPFEQHAVIKTVKQLLGII